MRATGDWAMAESEVDGLRRGTVGHFDAARCLVGNPVAGRKRCSAAVRRLREAMANSLCSTFPRGLPQFALRHSRGFHLPDRIRLTCSWRTWFFPGVWGD